MRTTAARAYMQTKVHTTSQEELVILLFSAAVRYLEQARQKMEEKDYAGKGTLISQALDVINELDSSLNMHKGGELAQNMHSLYIFCQTRLLTANLKMDVKMVDEVLKILQELKSAFEDIY
ncbi:MAG: flagellar export chaperone FliS [Desulfonatronovibrionaceae bacterium]